MRTLSLACNANSLVLGAFDDKEPNGFVAAMDCAQALGVTAVTLEFII